jgi:hypothetical protein
VNQNRPATEFNDDDDDDNNNNNILNLWLNLLNCVLLQLRTDEESKDISRR